MAKLILLILHAVTLISFPKVSRSADSLINAFFISLEKFYRDTRRCTELKKMWMLFLMSAAMLNNRIMIICKSSKFNYRDQNWVNRMKKFNTIIKPSCYEAL